ncbi:MAG: TonB-dependent receptor domain-containing protein [Steroidobacteraceae bacterium]
MEHKSRLYQTLLTVLALIVVAVTSAGLRAECAKTDPVSEFNIPAGELGAALVAAHQQGRLNFSYEPAAVPPEVRVQAVSGRFTACEALSRMFSGTGLTFSFSGANAVWVQYQPPSTLQDHSAASSKRLKTVRYSPRERLLPGPIGLAEVVVTGTLIHGVKETGSPLVTIDLDELQRAPYATVQDAVRSLPLASRAGPSEAFNPVENSGNFNCGESLNLRGLGSGATLVLVDGRRQPPGGYYGDFVDVSNIPWSAIDHVEVLPDGASALYGADAVAGVVNIIMRDKLDGAETLSRLGSAPDGAAERLFAQLVGTHWDDGKFFLSYQYLNRTALAASARVFTANEDKTALGGTDLRSTLSNPGNILDPDTQLPIAAIPRGQSGTPLLQSQLLVNGSNLQNRMMGVQMFPDRVMHTGFFTGSQKISAQWQIFAEGRFTQREITQTFPAIDAVLAVPTSNPFFKGARGSGFALVGYSFLNDFGPIDGAGSTRSYSTTVGLTGHLFESWQTTLSVSYGQEHMHWRDVKEVNFAALEHALADSDPETAFNPFGDGSNTDPATLKAIGTDQVIDTTSSIADMSLMADGHLFSLPTGDAKLAVGTNFRREGIHHGQASSGSFGRRVASLFGELATPLWAEPDNPGAPRCDLSVAIRSEYYDDFGATTNPKTAITCVPSRGIKFRASWGRSYQAPRLTDLHDASHNQSGLIPVMDPQSLKGQSLALVVLGNNANLRPETATTWNAGLDFAPAVLPGLTGSFTFYSIDFRNEIYRLDPAVTLDTIASQPQWAPLVTRNPSQQAVASLCSSGSFFGQPAECVTTPPVMIIDLRFRNMSRTQLRGVDLQLEQYWSTRFGNFTGRVDTTYLFTYQQSISDSAPTADLLDTVGNPLSIRSRASLDWSQRKGGYGFGGNLGVQYAGAYKDTAASPARDVGSILTFDTNLRYRTPPGGGWQSGLEITLAATNIFNTPPPFVNRRIGYDSANAAPLGRIVTLFARKDW